MDILEKDKLKHNLASSDIWKQIKQIELDKIMNLSSGITEPLIMKGMLRAINDIDNWKIQEKE